MLFWQWITLLSVVWISNVQSDVGNGCKPPPPAVGPLNKFTRDAVDVAKAAGDVLLKFKNVADKFVSMTGIMGPVGGIISGLIDVFTPGCSATQQILEAIGELKQLINQRFDELEKQLKKAIKELEAFMLKLDWNEKVTNPLDALRGNVKALVANNFSSNATEPLIINCKSVLLGSPLAIARYISSVTTEMCKKKSDPATLRDNTTTSLDSPMQTDICMPRAFIEESGFDHKMAENIYGIVTSTILELTAYQAVCSNITWKHAAAIDDQNKQFAEKVNLIYRELPGLIKDNIERYWTEPAKEYAETFMAGSDPIVNAGKAFYALNQRFTWYHHQVFLFRWMTKANAGHTDGVITLRKDEKSSDIIFIARYRVLSDADKKDAADRYDNYIRWTATKMPELFCGPYGYNVTGCMTTVSFVNPKEVDPGVWLSGRLDKYAGGDTGSDRNHGYIYVVGRYEVDHEVVPIPHYQWGEGRYFMAANLHAMVHVV